MRYNINIFYINKKYLYLSIPLQPDDYAPTISPIRQRLDKNSMDHFLLVCAFFIGVGVWGF